MTLVPKLPPGRANRKALAYTAEIQRLRAAGYSFESIRLALADAGLEVSRTTIKREAAKRTVIDSSTHLHPPPKPTPRHPAPASSNTPSLGKCDEASPAPGSFVGDSRSGKEIVDAFMQGRITNPLMQERTRNEGRSD